MEEKWPCRHPGQCRRRPEGALGKEQKLPAAQERPTEEQAVSLQPMGAVWSRSPHAAMEEPPREQQMRTLCPWTLQEHPRNSPDWSCSPCGAACSGAEGLEEMLPEETYEKQCLKGGPHSTKLCWSSAVRAAACGQPKKDQSGKNSIPWVGPMWRRDRE